MHPVQSALHLPLRYSRRLLGASQLRNVAVTGEAPAAVVTALQKALLGHRTKEEAAWVARIERLRQLLLASPQTLEIEDFGAGPSHVFDDGSLDTVHYQTRTVARMTSFSKPPRWAYLLFRLVRELRPQNVVELGSCVGISACYQAAALELNGQGHLITLEGASVLADRSARSIEEMGLTHRASVICGRFSDTLDSALGKSGKIDMAFIDGHHIEEATLAYLERIAAVAGRECLLVFDDINWSDGMRRAWRTIVDDERFALTIETRSVGLAVISQSATSRQALKIAYS
ncbi:MAG TPA: class I SAM-dependent methyltransferase [Propionibacteriaceae bacterium]|jgi:predicted O-methyltransferase YrrM